MNDCKSVYILTRHTYELDYNGHRELDWNAFLAAFPDEKSALRHCVDNCGMKIVARDKEGMTLEPTRYLEGEYMPWNYGELDDPDIRNRYRLFEYIM